MRWQNGHVWYFLPRSGPLARARRSFSVADSLFSQPWLIALLSGESLSSKVVHIMHATPSQERHWPTAVNLAPWAAEGATFAPTKSLQAQ